VVEHFHAQGCDYASNTLVPTFPDGLDVEVVKASALRAVSESCTDFAEREHVTLGIYRRSDQFTTSNVMNPEDLSKLRWTVDTPDDLDFVRFVYDALYRDNPDFDMLDILALLTRSNRPLGSVSKQHRNQALDNLQTGAMLHQHEGIEGTS
jgi:spore coat polysaccharide biosynthesis protein SpsF